MKSYSKNVFRTIIKNISRFILMTLITLVGIAFVTGVGGISPKVTNSFNENFKNTNVPDLIIKSKSLTGFSQEEIDNYQEIIESTAHLIMQFSQEGGFDNASGF